MTCHAQCPAELWSWPCKAAPGFKVLFWKNKQPPWLEQQKTGRITWCLHKPIISRRKISFSCFSHHPFTKISFTGWLNVSHQLRDSRSLAFSCCYCFFDQKKTQELAIYTCLWCPDMCLWLFFGISKENKFMKSINCSFTHSLSHSNSNATQFFFPKNLFTLSTKNPLCQ